MEDRVTFVIPSMCRSSLVRSISSLRNQTDNRWKAIVCFDNCIPTIEPDDKVSVIVFDGDSARGPDCPGCISKRKSSAGVVRNHAFAHVETEWVAFLDDDDMVTNDYVQRLLEESESFPECGAIVFRMLIGRGRPRFVPGPHASHDNFKHGSVGISFAVKKEILKKCAFARGRGEDFRLLNDIKSDGSRIHFSRYMTYLVRYEKIDDEAIRYKELIEKIENKN